MMVLHSAHNVHFFEVGHFLKGKYILMFFKKLIFAKMGKEKQF